MVKKTNKKTRSATQTQVPLVSSTPRDDGELSAHYVANRRENDNSPTPSRKNSLPRGNSHRSSTGAQRGSVDRSAGHSAASQYGIPGSSSIGQNSSLRGAATSAWIQDHRFAIPDDIPGRRPSSINSEPIRHSRRNESDNQSVRSEKQLKSTSKPPSIPTTILEQSDRSTRSNESEAPPSRSSSVEPMPSKKASRRRAEKQRHHGATRIEDEEDFDFQERLLDDARENRNTASADPPVLSEASTYLKKYLELCNNYERDVNDVPEDLLDYAYVKATHTYERTLSSILEKRARSGGASGNVPTAQDKFLDNAREKLKRYKQESTFVDTSGYNPAGINSRSQFAKKDSRVISGGKDDRRSVKPKSERESVGLPPSSTRKNYHSILDRSEDPAFSDWMKEWQGRVALQNIRNMEIRKTGVTNIPDQGIGFDSEGLPYELNNPPPHVRDRSDPPLYSTPGPSRSSRKTPVVEEITSGGEPPSDSSDDDSGSDSSDDNDGNTENGDNDTNAGESGSEDGSTSVRGVIPSDHSEPSSSESDDEHPGNPGRGHRNRGNHRQHQPGNLDVHRGNRRDDRALCC